MENTHHMLNVLIQNPSNKSFEIDQILGLDYQKIEDSIQKKYEKSYQDEGLNDQGLYTSYYDYYQILKQLDSSKEKEQLTICDLGAGPSRISVVSQICFPHIKVITIEHVKERVEAAKFAFNQIGLDITNIHCSDLEEVSIPDVDVYFLYWPVCGLLDSLLDQIRTLSLKMTRSVVAIESHGDFIFHLQTRANFLKLNDKSLKAITPRHDQTIYFFQSRPVDEIKKINDDIAYYTHQLENNLVIDIRDIENIAGLLLNLRHRSDILVRIKEQHLSLGEVEWVALIEDLELFYDGKTLVFKYPRRHVLQAQVLALQMTDYLPEEILEKLRSKKIGKVFISPNTFYEEI